MVRENGFIITVIINFILFLSLIPVVFSLKGSFALFELVFLIILIIIALILMSEVAKLNLGAWRAFFVFYAINLINQLVIYFQTYKLSPLILPFIITFLGFLIAIMKIKTPEDEEFEPEIMYDQPEIEPEIVVEPVKEVKTRKTAAKRKTTKKKPKKKPAKKKTKKKTTRKKKK